MIHLYNSLTRKKEAFVPREPGKIGIYVCGITVYDFCHLGHARLMVSFDVIVRFLRSQGFQLNYVRNITDIDDKIIARANELQMSITALTEKYIEVMHRDAAALNILPPDREPRATDNIPAIIELIQSLLKKGFAYQGENGDVYYEVHKFKEYGKLSNKDLENLIAGVRVEVALEKLSPLDFVLWKRAKTGEPSWPSPWGDGRPGWHIECSAMAIKELGETFDIHGGGLDLQFPHHENEIAQSEAASEKPFANYWLHLGMLQVNHEKMAKSLGNFFTIQDVLKNHHPEVVRYFLLSAHYRSPLNYSEENLHNAHAALTRLYQSIKAFDNLEPSADKAIDKEWEAAFNKAMSDDFNTPEALAILFSLSREINKTNDLRLAYTLKKLSSCLGLLESQAETFLQKGINQLDLERVESLIAARLAARNAKKWQEADNIRAQLLEMGVEVEDGSTGTQWRLRSLTS